MMDAKLKLDGSPREIRNCGSFNLVKGTFSFNSHGNINLNGK